MSKHKVVVFGGGTFNPIACHLALSTPAFGETAKRLHRMFEADAVLDSQLVLTRMADSHSKIMTNNDLSEYVKEMVKDQSIKVVVMNAAICDFEMDNPSDEARLSSGKDYAGTLKGIQGKVLSTIRLERPDIILAGFKTTHGASASIQLARAAASMAASDLDLVLANDLQTRTNLMLDRFLTTYRGTREDLLQRMVRECTAMYRSAAWFG